jgi:hypothetical protein
LAPIIGSALLQQLGTDAPGIFGALMLAGLLIHVLKTIYKHEIVHTLERHENVSTTAAS